jgi:hypothetical protein
MKVTTESGRARPRGNSVSRAWTTRSSPQRSGRVGEAGTRHWASGEYGDSSFAAVVGRDITVFILGHSQLDTQVREPIGLDLSSEHGRR